MNLNLFLGQGLNGRNVYWANAENAHISILGQSGTGKTYLISRLAKEACRQGFNVVIPDYSDSFLQMQDSCVLHTDIRKINLDILSNSKGRDVEARAEELISSIRLFCKIGIAKQKNDSPARHDSCYPVSILDGIGSALEVHRNDFGASLE